MPGVAWKGSAWQRDKKELLQAVFRAFVLFLRRRNPKQVLGMKTLKFKGTEVSLSFDSYQNNGSLAVLMNTVPDDELYGVITVNLGSFLQTDHLAFVDENNLPGIGAWLRKNKIASPLGYKERSGFCQYELHAFHKHA